MFSMDAALGVLELLGCGEAYREYIFLCLPVAVTVLLFALSLYFFPFFRYRLFELDFEYRLIKL